MLCVASACVGFQSLVQRAPRAQLGRAGRPHCQEGPEAGVQGGLPTNINEIAVPVPFRPMTRQEIVDKLNSVPTFSVVNDDDTILATPDAEGDLSACFYLELADAQAALADLRAANPRVALGLSATPLGTAYALSEWAGVPQTDAESFAEAAAVLEADGVQPPAAAGDSGSGELSAVVGGSGGGEQQAVRLQASAAEVEAVADLLEEAPAPPLLMARNRRAGAVPLFGSDAIRFQYAEEVDGEEEEAEGDEAAEAAGGAEGGGGERRVELRTAMPLFLRREDLLTAWRASGGAADKAPPVQLTDLRTLAWQMQVDDSQDRRGLVFVAPEEAIAFVRAQQTQGSDEAEAAAASAQAELSRADLEGLIFGSSGGPL